MSVEAPAIQRLQANVKVLMAAVLGLEEVLRAGVKVDSEPVRQALPFLRLIWALATAMCDILRAKRADGRTVWNAPALMVLARSLQDAYIGFYYFAAERADDQEQEFRRLLWSRHQAFKRMDLLTRSDQSVLAIRSALPEARRDFDAAQAKLLSHPVFSRLSPGIASKVRDNKEQFIAEPFQDVWARSGMPGDQYDPTFRYLSQGTHATPYMLTQLAYHEAGTEDGAVNMNVPIGLAVSCCVSTLHHAGALHEEFHSLMPAAFRAYMGRS